MQISKILQRDAILWALIFVSILLLHLPLLQLPYFWDEAGHYIPAARDFMLTGDVIPQSTTSNAHPPLPMFYLALAWSVFGYAPLVTRVVMLMVAAFGLLQVFRVAERVANREVAIAATICSALYPVIFAQSSLAHADLLATALALWGLRLYLEERKWTCVVAFSLATLSKETAILFPLAVFSWEIVTSRAKARRRSAEHGTAEAMPFPKFGSGADISPLAFLVPAFFLALWFAYHYSRTGYFFGNPEFFRYNVATTFEPVRILLAAARRIWQVTGYMNLWVLTASMMAAMLLTPLEVDGVPRPRISIPTQLLFLALIVAHVVGHSVVGGAVLARYMMAVVPLVIIIALSTLWRRVSYWEWVAGFAALAFMIGWVAPPLTSFAPEDNLNYAAYVRLHQKAASYVESKYPRATVLTAWTASDELTHPYLGYVQKPIKVLRIGNFSAEQLTLARQNGDYDVALLFSTRIPRSQLFRWKAWEDINRKYFDLHEDLPPELAALMLNGRMVMKETENGQRVAVLVFDRVRNGD